MSRAVPERQRGRGALGVGVLALAFGGALVLLVGCGDDVADPIVRVADDPSAGGGGGGTKNGGDTLDLCSPCGSRSDCNGSEYCVQVSRGTPHFCSRACGNGNGHCPSGYVCADVNNVSSMQCVPESGSCDQVVP